MTSEATPAARTRKTDVLTQLIPAPATDALPPHRDPQTVAAADAALAEFTDVASSLSFAMLIADDGFEISRTPARVTTGGQLASSTSTLNMLAEMVTSELSIGMLSYAYIESDLGHVLVRRVPGQRIVLVAVFTNQTAAGLAVSFSRRPLDNFSQRLAA